ncbi:MAG: hypothetical protein WCR42_10305, partial [bacterium]
RVDLLNQRPQRAILPYPSNQRAILLYPSYLRYNLAFLIESKKNRVDLLNQRPQRAILQINSL